MVHDLCALRLSRKRNKNHTSLWPILSWKTMKMTTWIKSQENKILYVINWKKNTPRKGHCDSYDNVLFLVRLKGLASGLSVVKAIGQWKPKSPELPVSRTPLSNPANPVVPHFGRRGFIFVTSVRDTVLSTEALIKLCPYSYGCCYCCLFFFFLPREMKKPPESAEIME